MLGYFKGLDNVHVPPKCSDIILEWTYFCLNTLWSQWCSLMLEFWKFYVQ